jgi:hypothetical protein
MVYHPLRGGRTKVIHPPDHEKSPPRPLGRETKNTGVIFRVALKRGRRIPLARRQVFMNEILEIIYLIQVIFQNADLFIKLEEEDVAMEKFLIRPIRVARDISANGHSFREATISQVTDSFSEGSVPEPFMRG